MRTAACAGSDWAMRAKTTIKCCHAVTKLEWKAPLDIVKYPDPRLRAVNAKVAVFDESLMALAKEMIRLMYL